MTPTKQQKAYDCFNACVASILEMPLNTMPAAEIVLTDGAKWDLTWEEFLNSLNLTINCVDYRATVANMGAEPRMVGYQIVNVKGWSGLNHAIVIKDGKQVWDPAPGNPALYPKSAWQQIEFLQVLDPCKPIGRAAL